MQELQALDGTFAALADPTRRDIIVRLMNGSARVTEIAAPFEMSLNAVSKHVKYLERAGLVRREVRGREHWLHYEESSLRAADEWISRMQEFWEEKLDALDNYVTEKER